MASIWRTLFLEISRIFNHLLAIVTHAIDVGAFTPFLWAFEERENLIEFYETTWGARMHTPYLIVGGIIIDIPLYFLDQIYKWMLIFPVKLQEIHTILTFNRIWKVRLASVGMINKKIIESYALTGPIIRGSNIKFDLRLLGYEFYNNLELGVTAGAKGDCLDRYLIRMNESLESIKIIQQLYHTWKVMPTNNNSCNEGLMESLIDTFRFIFLLLLGSSMIRQEAPKGELSLYLITDNRNKVYRLKIRSPD
jgi:NADH dehydrogenase (ubiquinone) Fe-S protein 2